MALNQLLFQLEVTVWKWQLLALIQRKHVWADTGLFFVFVRVLYMLFFFFSFLMLYFLPLARYSASDVGSRFQKSLHGVRMGQHTAQASKDIHGCSFGIRQSVQVPEGCGPKATVAKFIVKHLLGGDVPNTVPFLVVVSLPQSHCSWILPASQKQDERGRRMKIPYIKYLGQKINQHRLQIYDLHCCRIYQISCWNIYGQHLVIPGSPGTSGKMWK